MIGNVRLRIQNFFASIAFLSLQVTVILGLFAGAMISFIFLAKMVFAGKKQMIDQLMFEFLSRHINRFNTDVMEFFTFLGTHKFLIPANLLLILYFLFIKKHKWYSIKVPVVALSSLLLMTFLKVFFHRDRPSDPLIGEAEGFSFPSGHALMSVTFYGLLIYILSKNNISKPLKHLLIILMVFLILCIGLSRVYLRYHFATDVIAGYCVGTMWLIVSLWVLSRIEKYGSHQKVE